MCALVAKILESPHIWHRTLKISTPILAVMFSKNQRMLQYQMLRLHKLFTCNYKSHANRHTHKIHSRSGKKIHKIHSRSFSVQSLDNLFVPY